MSEGPAQEQLARERLSAVRAASESGLPEPEGVPPVSAERLVDGEVADGQARRRYPSTLGGACYLAVLVAAFAGVVVAARGDWRLGVTVLGGSLLGAAVARLLVPSREAGMLGVRTWWLDVLLLTGVGVALIVLAQTIPAQP